ncbi:MAG: alkaline phosphatase [Lewinellaceae bacterium]|nr:alkaline phosphatase [Lewinellaceae bacterium]
MVEGSQIDWALHANDGDWLKTEMLDFDATVSAALRFAETNGETLVIVTGDHECGGLGLNRTSSTRNFDPAFSARLHSAAMVPVFAFGPQAGLFPVSTKTPISISKCGTPSAKPPEVRNGATTRRDIPNAQNTPDFFQKRLF